MCWSPQLIGRCKYSLQHICDTPETVQGTCRCPKRVQNCAVSENTFQAGKMSLAHCGILLLVIHFLSGYLKKNGSSDLRVLSQITIILCVCYFHTAILGMVVSQTNHRIELYGNSTKSLLFHKNNIQFWLVKSKHIIFFKQ